jgi:hypothetical protein
MPIFNEIRFEGTGGITCQFRKNAVGSGVDTREIRGLCFPYVFSNACFDV